MDNNTFYKGLGAAYRSQDMQAIETYLESSLAEVKEEKPLNESLLCMIYNEMGSFYRGTSRYERSLEAFGQAAALLKRLKGEKNGEYAALTNNTAGTYRLMGDYDRAIAMYKKAFAIYEELGDTESYPYASVHNNISQAYQATGELDLALVHMEKALPLIEKLPKHAHEVAVSYMNLGAIYYRMNRFAEAHDCADKAMAICESLDEKKIVHYAAALNLKGHLFYREGKYDEALTYYEKSADYTKRFFGENVEYKSACENIERTRRKLSGM